MRVVTSVTAHHLSGKLFYLTFVCFSWLACMKLKLPCSQPLWITVVQVCRQSDLRWLSHLSAACSVPQAKCSFSAVHIKLRGTFSDVCASNMKTIYKYVRRFCAAGLLLKKKTACRRHAIWVLDTVLDLETYPRSLIGISVSSTWNVTQVLCLYPCKTTVVYRMLITQWSKAEFLSWEFLGVYETSFDFSAKVNSHNNWYLSV